MFWWIELENILLPITCYYLVENICFVTLYQLGFSLQIILSTFSFLLPYSAQSLITNLLVCSEISKHLSLPSFPALLFSFYPTCQDTFSPLSVLFEITVFSYLGPLPPLSSFEAPDLHFLDGRKGDVEGKLSASVDLNTREGWRIGEERGAGVGEGC